jgi:pimeloyl-ACP methyl ester carboxylesterase
MIGKHNQITCVSILMAVSALVGPLWAESLMWPLQVGLHCEYSRSDALGNAWTVLADIDDHMTANSQEYFRLRVSNYDNDSAVDTYYMRSTENAVYEYYSGGPEQLVAQKAPVGRWFFAEESGGYSYRVVEIVGIEAVSVPYGTFTEAYVHCNYKCNNPDDPGSDKSPEWYDWMVPGVGMVKEVDYWARSELNPPLTEELVKMTAPPTIKIVEAEMISPHELGIGIEVQYPDYGYETTRNVKFRATINGKDVETIIDVTSYTRPGQVWQRALDPTTPLKIDLAAGNVPKFAENQDFTLTGEAYCEEGGRTIVPASQQDPIDVEIPLPVVVLHGYVYSWPYESIPFGYSAYRPFKDFLVDNGYENKDTWDTDDGPKYRTLWDPEPPASPMYPSPTGADATAIRDTIDTLLSEVWEHNYASKVDFVGHSFGGLVARYYASERPANVNKVITVGAPHDGLTEFYNKAFSMSRTQFEGQCPEGSVLRWTVPTYPCTYLKSRRTAEYIPPLSISALFTNTLTRVQGSGVRYWSVYNSYFDKRTPKSLFLTRTDDWYEHPKCYETAPGDVYVLAESASGFGTPVPLDIRRSHEFLLQDPVVHAEVLGILRK